MRPRGLRPSYGPTEELDFELELGFVTGPGKPLGHPIGAADVRDHVFGFVLVNDWSARDIQRFEYRPLGPFLGKSFATSISAWVTPLAALEPYLVPAREQDPQPDDYLRTNGDWALDIALEVEVNGETVTRGNARHLYWTFPQQLAHATVNGAAVRPGDLFASGTISGTEPGTPRLPARGGHRLPRRRRRGDAARPRGHDRARRGARDDRQRAVIAATSRGSEIGSNGFAITPAAPSASSRSCSSLAVRKIIGTASPSSGRSCA